MKRTANEIVKEMENTDIMMKAAYTFSEYVQESIAFQNMICKMIAGDAYHEKMRVDEALFIMESTARKMELRSIPAVHNGVMTMKQLEKDLAITMSGAKGESMVSTTLEFLKRPNTRIFRNVYVTDGLDETELDAIVLTDSGAIILEVKKVKNDLTLTEDGRMVFAGDECFDKIPLGEKMALKRRLLKKYLESTVAEKGLDIPVYVDSYIVFSAPRNKFIQVNDYYHKEKYCFRTNLNSKIDNYLGYTYYKADDLSQIGQIIAEMETNVKRFETKLNYDEVRRNLAEALAILWNAQEDLNADEPEEVRVQQNPKRHGFAYSMASAVASFLMSSATAILNMVGGV